ncbi:protein POOR-like proteinOUS SYNAPSIS 1 [Abeliophyllum distichum]|uniref:Protein POOR-like proteinOUS SYNAPSIS 1 n=1 Tax=Abeliophyllum distichum TaxID=126358 RepID=A0ABD1RBB8_9LAMI
MAGAMVTIPTNHLEMENTTHSHSQILPIIEQWQIQCARFINYSSSNFSRTHASLSTLATVQKKHLRGGVLDFLLLHDLPQASIRSLERIFRMPFSCSPSELKSS